MHKNETLISRSLIKDIQQIKEVIYIYLRSMRIKSRGVYETEE